MDPGYKVDVKPDKWLLPNRLGFNKFIETTFAKGYKKNKNATSGMCVLSPHQKIIKDFLQYDSPYRGLIVYHGLGVGKTRTSIATAEVLSTHLDIVVLLPAAIEQNYINEILKCGNNTYTFDKHWAFVPKADMKSEHKNFAEENGVDATILRKNKGVWIFDDKKKPNYVSKSDSDKGAIKMQIDVMIKKRYTFVHYDGFSEDKVVALGKHYFDNKVVIVDEVHNFISYVANLRTIGGNIYKLMMEATNAKVILLSGTPMINRPIEMGLLINLARGNLEVVMFKYTLKGKFDEGQVSEILDTRKDIDFYDWDKSKREIRIVLLPTGFEKLKDGFVKRNETMDSTSADILASIQQDLANVGVINKQGSKVLVSTILPSDEEAFESLFIDYTSIEDANKAKNPIMNEMLLSRRIQGLVSYYETYDPKQYPTLMPMEYVKVNMSNEHFTRYMHVRQIEYEKDERDNKFKKNKNNDNDLQPSSLYRSYSRASCNYCFPSTIQRVYPSDIRNMKDEMDVYEEDDHVDKKTKKVKEEKKATEKKYMQSLENAMTQLWNDKDTFLDDDGLETYGPKYIQIINRLSESKGPVMIYSQFSHIEGLGIMKLALNARGYVPLNVKFNKNNEIWAIDVDEEDWNKPKYITFTADKVKNKILMDIFNSDFELVPSELLDDLNTMHNAESKNDRNKYGSLIRVLMITKRGAEGISLKNVRQVHLLEPYWNTIRVKQVIGRAVRAGSHLALDPVDRKVEAFIYITTFNKKQKEDQTVINRDRQVTTDEHIMNISIRKSHLVDSLQDIMKASAIDCTMHKDVHNQTCFVMRPGFETIIKDNIIHSNQDASEDVLDSKINMRTVTKTVAVKRLKMKKATSDDEKDDVVKEKVVKEKSPKKESPESPVKKIKQAKPKVKTLKIVKVERKIDFLIRPNGGKIPYDVNTMELFNPTGYDKTPKEFIVIGKVVIVNNKPKAVPL